MRSLIPSGSFFEVYLSTPLSVCETRDPKGLYRLARFDDLPNMTDIGSVYEPPEQPELILNTDPISIGEAVEFLMQELCLTGVEPR